MSNVKYHKYTNENLIDAVNELSQYAAHRRESHLDSVSIKVSRFSKQVIDEIDRLTSLRGMLSGVLCDHYDREYVERLITDHLDKIK